MKPVGFVIGFCCFWTIFLCLYGSGIRFNITPSLPMGVYQADFHLHPEQIRPGTIVMFCLPDSPVMRLAERRHYLGTGPCPGKTLPLLKPVAAVSGDAVVIKENGIEINEAGLLKNSKRLIQDVQARTLRGLPNGHYRVPPGAVWVLSTYSPRSFDSRYYGAVPVSSIQATVKPLITTGG
jgi:conjugative transfer signal peptidase TraF